MPRTPEHSVLEHFQGAASGEGLSVRSALDGKLSFAPGAYIPARELSEIAIDAGIQQVIRERTAFVALHASDLVALNSEGRFDPREAKQALRLAAQGSGNINSYFDIVYAQKALYSKAELLPGNSLAISPGGVESGCYGFYDFDRLLEPPFVTVPCTGSIAMA
ncbi:MAG: hypothetical protein GDA41_05610 [Rhodospirillales bacterium]|nr:hypothetical protein [Rhodospirillales bacterium]